MERRTDDVVGCNAATLPGRNLRSRCSCTVIVYSSIKKWSIPPIELNEKEKKYLF